MTNEFVVWGLLLAALICANLPFLNNRIFFVKSVVEGEKKPIAIRLIEWLLFYFIVGGTALLFEYKLNGQIHPQDWEFYAVTFFMFLVLGIPGFIYRYTFLK